MTAMDWIIILGLPMMWTVLAEALRTRLRGARRVPDDDDEKRFLLVMLAPVGLGVALVAIGRLMPVPLPPLRMLNGLPDWLGASATSAPVAAHSTMDVGLWLTLAGTGIYGAGAARMIWPLVASMARLRRIVAGAAPVVCGDDTVYLTDAQVPPLAWGRDRIVLPRALYERLSPAQLRLLIRHERAHLNRRDTLWFAWLGVVDALFWFNPFVRRQTRRCRVAAEIACDAMVIHAAPGERETYAELLLGVLRHFAADALPGVAAMAAKYGDYRMRLEEILHTDVRPARSGNMALYATLTAAFLSLAGAQFAWSQPHIQPVSAVAGNGFQGFWTDDMLRRQDTERAAQEAEVRLYDPANLHRRLAAEPRDAAWADAQEKALYAEVGPYSADGVDKVAAMVRCGSTLCEVDLKFAFTATDSRDQVHAATRSLYQRLGRLYKAVPGFTPGSTTATLTPDDAQKPWPDTIAVAYYQRNGS